MWLYLDTISKAGILTKYLKHLRLAWGWISYGNALQQNYFVWEDFWNCNFWATSASSECLPNLFVQIVKCICPNIQIYLSLLPEIVFESSFKIATFGPATESSEFLWNVFVQSVKYIHQHFIISGQQPVGPHQNVCQPFNFVDVYLPSQSASGPPR